MVKIIYLIYKLGQVRTKTKVVRQKSYRYNKLIFYKLFVFNLFNKFYLDIFM